jgi:uncharacterized phage protein (predicted DNA packaging)
MILSVAEAKDHLRVDHDDDDPLIEGCIAAAVDHVERFTGLTLVDGEVPAGITQALKMLVQSFYDDRDGTSEPPAAVAALLRPHRPVLV